MAVPAAHWEQRWRWTHSYWWTNHKTRLVFSLYADGLKTKPVRRMSADGYPEGSVNNRAPKGGGFSLDYSMTNILQFIKIRDIGLFAPVRLGIPGRPLCRFTREGRSRQCRHWNGIHLQSTPQPQSRRVSITRTSCKRQNHFNLSIHWKADSWQPKSASSAWLKPAVSAQGVL